MLYHQSLRGRVFICTITVTYTFYSFALCDTSCPICILNCHVVCEEKAGESILNLRLLILTISLWFKPKLILHNSSKFTRKCKLNDASVLLYSSISKRQRDAYASSRLQEAVFIRFLTKLNYSSTELS